jgi:glyoxylase-like metal-dependent hydrolase (beta-lactamase superfamily II)
LQQNQFEEMKITAIIADYWKMDGGVAFGVVPKSLWTKVYPEDENNLLRIVTRCLLIETDNRNILIDTGMGNKRGNKYYNYKYRVGKEGLIEPLKNAGLSPAEITDVIFTHLHDDHVGGATFINAEGKVEEFFKNARYWVTSSHWEWSKSSNKREAAAYFTDNLEPLEKSGRLNLINAEGKWIEGIEFRIFNGHTRGQLIPLIRINNKTLVFTADFIPAKANIPIAYIPAVDIEPLVTMREKEIFLNEAFDKGYLLMFEHDYYCEACSLKLTEKGIEAGEMIEIHKLN